MSAQLCLRKKRAIKAIYLDPTATSTPPHLNAALTKPDIDRPDAVKGMGPTLVLGRVRRAPPAVHTGTKHTSSSPSALTRKDDPNPCVC
ncbi:hypothetical protein COCON_G00087410 [Conger conger]|uniref:Uncharacterized protein n=1 Tax=Conger conger TaxID=82655 RepID=A0A9Q1HZT9_CONCO|nr:hypothetical protein COCON_G00087410 [Conger conger]